jgi:hypothetical protein
MAVYNRSWAVGVPGRGSSEKTCLNSEVQRPQSRVICTQIPSHTRPTHKKTSEHQPFVDKSLNARFVAVPYPSQRRVPDRDDLDMTIRTYYNLLWNTHGNKEAILVFITVLG